MIIPFAFFSSEHFFNDYYLRNIPVLWANLKMNLFRSFLWLKIYYTLPILLIILLGSIKGILNKELKIIWALSWAFAIIILDSFVGGKLFYPRHLFPLAVPLSFIIAYACFEAFPTKRAFPVLIVFIVIIVSWRNNLNLITHPQLSTLAPEDKLQFFEDWSSGVGLKEISNDLKKLSENQQIYLYVGDEALLTWALPNIYGVGNTKIDIIKNYVGGETEVDLSRLDRGENYYLLLNKEPYPPRNFPVQLISSYAKGPNRTIDLYHLTPAF